ncbi:MAG: M14 family metallopeptidase [Opitutaceae bacterium]
MNAPIDVDQLLRDFYNAAHQAGFKITMYERAFGYPLLVLQRSSECAPDTAHKVFISTGIHGDEPAPPLALLKLLQADSLPRSLNLTICPCINPAGLATGTRENPDGIDLNRDFTHFNAIETKSLEKWIRTHIDQLDLAIHLHEDWETQGFYLYELNLNEHASRAAAILAAANKHLPIQSSSTIDGHVARGGIIRPSILPDIPEGLPEAIYLQKAYGLLDYTLETPSSLPMEKRIAATQAALLAAIDI